MPRIRSIKPEFFTHPDLFDLEDRTKLPVRLAFAGLWTVADREGRFRWRPRVLKSDVLPYDDVDFGAVLDALASGGFVIKYEVDGSLFGFIPSWREHQRPHPRETESQLPPPQSVGRRCSGSAKARPRQVLGAAQAVPRHGLRQPKDSISPSDLGNGDLGNGYRIKDKSCASRTRVPGRAYPPGFAAAWDAYPHHGTRSAKRKAAAVWTRRGLEAHSANVLRWIAEAKTSDDWTKDGGQFIPGMHVWLGGHDFAEEPTVERERHRPFRLGARREPAIPTPCEHCPHDSRRHELRADTTWPCREAGCECSYFVAAETVAANERG